jgi:hypothetical protein
MFQVEIVVKGWIDQGWSDWLGDLTILYCEPDLSVLRGLLPDQAAAYGLVARLRDYGFPLSLVKIEEVEEGKAPNPSG